MKYRHYLTTLLISFALLLISLPANAQDIPINIMGLEYGQSIGNDNKGDFTNVDIYGLAPIVSNKDHTVISLPYFNYRSIDNTNLALPSSNFYQFSLPLAMQTSISSSKSLGVFAFPTMSSDLAKPDSKNFNISAAVFLSNRSNSSFIFRYGIYYSYSTNGQILIPVFNYYWMPTKHFRINGNNPLNPKASYKVAPRVRLGLEFRYDTRLYNLSKSKHDRYVSDTRTILAPYVDYNLTENILLNLKGGYAFQRKIEVYKGVDRSSSWYTGFKDRDPLKSQNQKGWFIRGGLRLQIMSSLD